MLGRWVDFARSAAALSTEGPAGLLRASVTDIITLQAIWFALGHLSDLSTEEQAIGLDRAQLLLDKHRASLHSRFAGKVPPQIEEVIADVETKLAEALADERLGDAGA